MSFVQFLRTQPRDVSAAAALEAYHAREAQWKQQHAQEFFQAHKSDGMLVDLHRGTHLLRSFDWRHISARQAAASFIMDLKAGAFTGLSLATSCVEAEWTKSGSGGLGSAAVPGPPHSAPHFLADPGRFSMVLDSVPASLSVWDFHEVLRQKPGFIDVWLDEPAPRSILRGGLACFESDADLDAAIRQLGGALVEGYALQPARAPPQERHRVVLAPAAASEPPHVAAVSGLAASVITALDAALGFPEAGTREVLEAFETQPEARLDLRTLYLRRVHRFCLYSVAQCADARELLRRCGAACLRARGPASGGQGAWAEEHLRNLRGFLAATAAAATAPARPEPVPASTAGGPLDSRWAALCRDCMKREGEGRYRCLKCSKMFKGEDYLQKHLLKVHHQELCRLVREVRDEQMRETYQRAQKGPGWN